MFGQGGSGLGVGPHARLSFPTVAEAWSGAHHSFQNGLLLEYRDRLLLYPSYEEVYSTILRIT